MQLVNASDKVQYTIDIITLPNLDTKVANWDGINEFTEESETAKFESLNQTQLSNIHFEPLNLTGISNNLTALVSNFNVNCSQLLDCISQKDVETPPNWWGLAAILIVLVTSMGNILVILAISWDRRLQNMTNYFLLSLAATDLMVAIFVMPIAIVVLVLGK